MLLRIVWAMEVCSGVLEKAEIMDCVFLASEVGVAQS